MVTILTLALDPESQQHFEAMRQRYYPAHLNRIPAHLSLFHHLPGDAATEAVLREVADSVDAFQAAVTGVRSLGRGVAYTIAAPELLRIHAELARRFDADLIPQDRQRFQPHIVVQNKATPGEAKELLASVQAGFAPFGIRGTGLQWWEYLGGPWQLLETFDFRSGVSPRHRAL